MSMGGDMGTINTVHYVGCGQILRETPTASVGEGLNFASKS